MDIHKPKPWHGIREFLKEYVIIVVGVLTALGAEAVVERFHEARLSREAEIAVRDEINVNITNLARRFEPERERCVARRLDELSALLDKAEAGQAFTPPSVIGGQYWAAIYTQRWDAATAGGRTSLLSSEEQRKLGRIYASFVHLDEDIREDRRVWLTLRALTRLRHLSPEMIHDERLAVSQAQDLDLFIRETYNSTRFSAGLLGVKGDARLAQIGAPHFTVPDICKPLSGSPSVPGGR